MAKAKSVYRCSQCSHTVAKWVGRCPDCGTWGTIDQAPTYAAVASAGAKSAGGLGGAVAPMLPSTPALPLTAIDSTATVATGSGVSELDRVLGGGIVPGSVILLAGEPGVGKSTLLLEVVSQWARAGRRALYVTGEESAGQVRLRAERTGAVHDQVYLASESDLATVVGHVHDVRPSLVIVDSVQTMVAADTEGVIGGVTQVRAVTSALTSLAKSTPVAVLIVGHVTKDGAVAGPRSLEHLVDVVLHFEGDKHSTLRTIRGIKNRFGASDEVGCFELHDSGIRCVEDPSGLFLQSRDEAVPGTAVTVVMDGKRPLLGEVQALTVQSAAPAPRRAVSGLDSPRVAMVLAVLQKHLGLKLGDRDVYASTVGGMRMSEPATDLAVALAMASAQWDRALPTTTVVIGEVGLAGEIRRVSGVPRRLAEARRLGFRSAIVPAGSGPAPEGMYVTEVSDIRAAAQVLKQENF